LIGPSPKFLEHWALPNTRNSLDRQLQNRNKCAPFGLHKSKVLLGTIWGTTWEHGKPFGNLMGAHMEYYGNEGNKQKKKSLPPPPPPPQVDPHKQFLFR